MIGPPWGATMWGATMWGATTWAAHVAFALLALGCGRTHGPADGDVPRGIDAATFVERFAALYCERVAHCAAPTDIHVWLGAAPDVDCAGIFSGYGEELRREFAEGAVEIDVDAAARCLENLATTCHLGDPRRIAGCGEAIVGTRTLGESCHLMTCAPGGVCPPMGSCSVCLAAAREGEACDVGCDVGLSCVAGVCERATPLSEGVPCDEGGVICGPELYCTRTCEPFGREGEICDPMSWPVCGPTLACAEDAAGALRCTATRVAAVGEACDDVTTFCERLHRVLCLDGTCEAIGGGVGARCDRRPIADIDCDDGLACVDDVCVAGLADESRCTDARRCLSGACLDGRCGVAPPVCP